MSDILEKQETIRLIKKSIKDNESFKLLIKKYSTIINHYMHKYGFKDREIEDVRQIILISIWKSLVGYDPTKSKFIGFLKVIVSNCLKSELVPLYALKRNTELPVLEFDKPQGDGDYSLHDLVFSKEVNNYDDREEIEYLHKKLYEVLTKVEKKVYMDYLRRSSYNGLNWYDKNDYVKIKSIDNALSRVKRKASEISEIYNRTGKVNRIDKKSINEAIAIAVIAKDKDKYKDKYKKVVKKVIKSAIVIKKIEEYKRVKELMGINRLNDKAYIIKHFNHEDIILINKVHFREYYKKNKENISKSAKKRKDLKKLRENNQ